MKSFLQLVSQRLLRDKLQEKLHRVTWPLNFNITVFCFKQMYKHERTDIAETHLKSALVEGLYCIWLEQLNGYLAAANWWC